MKRILALLCVIACLCGLCVPAFAASTIIVSVKAPDDWSEVNLYAWESDENRMSDWPGTAMTPGDDGWFYLEVPAGYPFAIANNGTAQTVDLKMDGNVDTWITVTDLSGDKYNAVVALDPEGNNVYVPPVGSVPMALAGTGIPGAADWAPGDAAGDMTMVAEGTYTKVVAMTAGATMTFKIAGNDMWDDNYNYGAAEEGAVVTLGTAMELTCGGGSQNITLNSDKDCNLKFTFTIVDGVYSLLVEETEEEADPIPDTPAPPEAPDAENITIYAKVPEDWTTVHLWAWKDGVGDVDPSGWPGTLIMTKGEDGWYSIQIPGWAEGILLHNGSGTQTPDMVIEAGKDVWVNALTDYSNPTFSYEEIKDITPPSSGGTTTGPQKPSASAPTTTEPQKTEVDNTLLITLIGSAVIIVAAVVVFFVLKNKKKAE